MKGFNSQFNRESFWEDFFSQIPFPLHSLFSFILFINLTMSFSKPTVDSPKRKQKSANFPKTQGSSMSLASSRPKSPAQSTKAHLDPILHSSDSISAPLLPGHLSTHTTFSKSTSSIVLTLRSPASAIALAPPKRGEEEEEASLTPTQGRIERRWYLDSKTPSL